MQRDLDDLANETCMKIDKKSGQHQFCGPSARGVLPFTKTREETFSTEASDLEYKHPTLPTDPDLENDITLKTHESRNISGFWSKCFGHDFAS